MTMTELLKNELMQLSIVYTQTAIGKHDCRRLQQHLVAQSIECARCTQDADDGFDT